MPKWRYRPDGNSTPVAHPTIGHLDHDGVYDHEDCADNPDFVEIHDKKILADDSAAAPTPSPEIEAPVVAPAPITKSSDAKSDEAGDKPGRS